MRIMDDRFDYDEYEDRPATTPGRGSLLDRVRQRMGDVRIHDSGLADDLTRRLGARAFTMGRDVYVRPDLLHAMTPQSEALLAHELFHVSEQTGVEMPLLKPSMVTPSASTPSRSPAISSSSVHVQRAPASRPAPASTSSSELAAEAIEAEVIREQAGESGVERASAKPPDPEDIADRVYALIAQDLILERERAAYGW
jgi:uncharacterized protein DUF4157